MEKAYNYNYDVLVFSTFIKQSDSIEFQLGESNIFNMVNLSLLDGIIYAPDYMYIPGLKDKLERMLNEQCTCPIVVLDTKTGDWPLIELDDTKTMENLVDHLIDVHHVKKINLITGPKTHMHAKARWNGYLNSMKKHGLSVDEEQVLFGDFWVDTAVAYIKEIIEGKIQWPEAIVCANDQIAMAICNELASYGYLVPKDMIVVGYDRNFDYVSKTMTLTHCETPRMQQGNNAVTLLYNMLEGANEPLINDPLGDILLGQSCGCQPTYNDIVPFLKEQQASYQLETFYHSNHMEENLVSSNTLRECMEKICWYTYQIPEMKEIYLCLCDEWRNYIDIFDNDTEEEITNDIPYIGERKEKEYLQDSAGNEYLFQGYTDNMMIYAKKVNNEARVNREFYDTRIILPALYEERDYPTTYFFTPLHFKDRCLGYTALSFGKEIISPNENYRTWVRNINNALEFIRIQYELRYYNQRLNRLAIRDELTGLYNRHGFNMLAEEMINNSKKTNSKILMLFGDMDNLKQINDKYGHLEGDNAIRTLAQAFMSACRNDEVCARVGGDEIIIVTEGVQSSYVVEAIQTHISQFLEDYNRLTSKPYDIRVSLGFYEARVNETEVCESKADEILKYFYTQADSSMYRNKQLRKLQMLK